MIKDVIIIALLMLSLGTTVMGMGAFIFWKWNKENDSV